MDDKLWKSTYLREVAKTIHEGWQIFNVKVSITVHNIHVLYEVAAVVVGIDTWLVSKSCSSSSGFKSAHFKTGNTLNTTLSHSGKNVKLFISIILWDKLCLCLITAWLFLVLVFLQLCSTKALCWPGHWLSHTSTRSSRTCWQRESMRHRLCTVSVAISTCSMRLKEVAYFLFFAFIS